MLTSTKTKLKKMTFSNFNQSEGTEMAYNRAKEFVENWPDVNKGLIFTGDPGVGKTHLAAAIANIVNGAYWLSMSEFLESLRPGSSISKQKERAEACYASTYGSCGVVRYGSSPTGVCRYCVAVTKDYRNQLEIAMEAPLTILDDLGTNKPTDWVAEQIYMLLNYRLEAELPVIATTNYSLRELEKRLGHDRIVSRLAGMCDVYRLEGEDWRLKQ